MNKTFALCMILVGAFSARAEDIRDYYSEPGLNPFKTTMGGDATENIDAFNGNLQLSYTDIVIPGNGGLNIEIKRVYNNPQQRPTYDDVVGVGWTMHFGRIVVPYQYGNAICGTAGNTTNNPSIEHPNGGRELLVLNAIENDGSLITKSNWRAECINSSNPQQGMLVTAPNGTEYRMSEYMAIAGPNNGVQASWYTSEIRDVHDNTIDITYGTLSGGNNNGRKYIDRISTSDGRTVRYEHIDERGQRVSSSSLSARISKIKAHYATNQEQVWEYRYEPADTTTLLGGLRRYHLTEVVRPDGLEWNYAYNPEFLDGSAGSYSLNHVSYPYGGEVGYTYQLVRFYASQTYETHAIASKSVSGRQITSGTWTYNFAPGSFDVDAGSIGTRQMDVTTVTAPNATHRYYYYGDKYARGIVNLNWTIGLLHRREVMDGTSVVERELNGWSRRQISTELYKQGLPGSSFDQGTFAAMMTQRSIHRDGTGNNDRGVTDYRDHDAYGNAGTVELSSNTDSTNKTTQLTYFNNKQRWIIGVTEDETIDGVGTIDRTYSPLGDLLSIDRYGVLTSYTYTSEGDLESQTDARGNKTTYGDYFRGTPQLENHEENVDISRIVNKTGTVASSTDGRGYTKAFSYDDLNRLIGIDFPRGADVAINWHNSGKTLLRGTYEEDVGVDGFGREIRFARSDTSTHETVIKTKRYDALGRLVFESYPSTTVNFSNGVRTQYETLDRVTRVTHQDGNVKRFNYKSYNLVEEVDERGYAREYLYRSYGHPSNERALVQVTIPVGDQKQATRISRNLLNQVTSVRQGKVDGSSVLGWTRRYFYDSRTFLEAEEHPETGETHYERDKVGNMSSRRVGDSEFTTYAYDKLNRLDTISFPFTQHDVVFEYDQNNNLTRVSKDPTAWNYAFDENNNLLSEELTATIASTTDDVNYTKKFQFNYDYTGNDYLKDIMYPSGFTVDYAPNALGRPKQVGTLIDAITYHP
ncbi:MAG: RHS repeat domain-containing protein, partial [Pseudomonadales bacterium]